MQPVSLYRSSKPPWYRELHEVIQLMMYWAWFEPREKPPLPKQKGYKRG